MNEISPAQEPRGYRERIYAQYVTQFQRRSLDFDRAGADRQQLAYAHYFRGWLPGRRDAAVVDLACGNGYLLHFFKQQGYGNLFGVDISPEQVKVARQVVPTVEQGSLFQFLKGAPARFDLITALDIVEHLHKDEVLAFLDLCFQALRPGGRLILQMPNADSPMGLGTRYGDFTHEVMFNSHSLSGVLGVCGFASFEAREGGPVPGSGVKSMMRRLLWQLIRRLIQIWHFIEMGNAGSGIFTRVFVASAMKPDLFPTPPSK